MTTLPPDQSLRVSTLNQRLIILSVAEKGIKIGEGTPYSKFSDASDDSLANGVYIFSEGVSVTSDISAPSGIAVSTWSLVCSEPGIVLAATGLDGAEDGETETDRHGKPGKLLSLYIQDLDHDACSRLAVRSRGGAGGNTKRDGGQVGDGGNGGFVIALLQSTYARLSVIVDAFFWRDEFHPSDSDKSKYSDPVKRNGTLYNGAKALLYAAPLSVTTTKDVMATIFDPLSQEIQKIDNKETRTVLQMKLALASARTTISNLIRDQEFKLTPAPSDTRGGYPGVGIGVTASNAGATGADGQQTFSLSNKAEDIAKAQIAFAHPVQCDMLLTRANLCFYINSPKLRSAARRYYLRIVQRVGFVLQSTDYDAALQDTYDKCPIMPSSSVADLRRIADEASNQLVHLNAGLTVRKNYNAHEQI
jgi:hypothetical protein